MEQKLAQILFRDDDKTSAEAARMSPVAPALWSERALDKIHTKRTENGEPVHSFQSLMRDLATICANKVQPNTSDLAFTVITTPTTLQHRALDLLGVSHHLGHI